MDNNKEKMVISAVESLSRTINNIDEDFDELELCLISDTVNWIAKTVDEEFIDEEVLEEIDEILYECLNKLNKNGRNNILFASGRLKYIVAMDENGKVHKSGWYYSEYYYHGKHYDMSSDRRKYLEKLREYKEKYPVVVEIITPSISSTIGPPPPVPPPDDDEIIQQIIDKLNLIYAKAVNKIMEHFTEGVIEYLHELYNKWRITGEKQCSFYS